MTRNHTRRILSVGIIVLFVGLGIHPAFAGEDKSFTESLTIDTENESPVTKSGEIYENTYCFVKGYADEAINQVFLFGKGDIVFGFKWSGESHPSSGWIYTSGLSKRWEYEGKFYGDVSSYQYKEWWYGLTVTRYVGIEDFRGLALGGHPLGGVMSHPNGAPCWFIGFAKHVKISPEPP